MDLKELKIHEEDSKRHPWEVVRSEVVFSILKKQFGHLFKEEINVLDAGCGDLYLAEQLSKRIPAWKFFAADNAFSTEQLANFRSEFRDTPISVFNSIEDAGKEMGKADIILLLDVIEHIEYDVAFLKSLQSQPFIGDQVRFLISVPAFQKLFCSHDIFLGHFRRYTPKTLKETADKASLHVIYSGYFFFFLLPFRFFQVIIEWLTNKRDAKGVSQWTGNKFIGFLFKSLLRADYYIFSIIKRMGINLPGLSTYIICKKSVS